MEISWWSSLVGGKCVEADIDVNTYYSWGNASTSNVLDLQTAFTHEIGHLLGLQHPSAVGGNSPKVMYYSLGTGQVKRFLSRDEKKALMSIY